MNLQDKIIKLLGGYTKKEYIRVERKYQGLLDSKTTNEVVYICNEHIYRVLQKLDNYAKKDLFGLVPDVWARNMYNVIHNNLLRIFIRYITTRATSIYTFDTSIDNKDEFLKIMQGENANINNEEDLFILETD